LNAVRACACACACAGMVRRMGAAHGYAVRTVCCLRCAFVCSQMFRGLSAFNTNIASWNTASVTSMSLVRSLPFFLHPCWLIALIRATLALCLASARATRCRRLPAVLALALALACSLFMGAAAHGCVVCAAHGAAAHRRALLGHVHGFLRRCHSALFGARRSRGSPACTVCGVRLVVCW
jgi:surface protein